MKINEINSFLKEDLQKVEALIEQSLQSDVALLDGINKSLREHPGKMLRSVLSLLVAGALGKVNESSLKYAAGTELLHNATLLHDDVVDGATLRRGRPTVSALLNNQASILIGDFWLVRCVQLVLQAHVEPEQVLRRFSATLSDLAEGELRQMELSGLGTTTEADYLRIIYGKTASLFVTAAVSAAISVKAPEPLCEAARLFASHLGMAFQIKDDIFDYAADSTLGKPTGIDLREQKITQPLLCALESVPEPEARAVREKVARIADHPEVEADIRSFVKEHDGIGRATAVMHRYLRKALEALEAFPASAQKDYLVVLTHYVGDRQI